MASLPMVKGGEEKPSSITYALGASAGGQGQFQLPDTSRDDFGYTKFKVTGSARRIDYISDVNPSGTQISFNTVYDVPAFQSHFVIVNTAQNGAFSWTYWEFFNE